MDRADGSIAMETIEDFATARAVDPLMVPTLAVILAFPTDREVARPVAATLATPLLLLVHTAVEVSSFEDPSLNSPVALNCMVWPRAMVEFCGETSNAVSCGVELVIATVPPQPTRHGLRRISSARHSPRLRSHSGSGRGFSCVERNVKTLGSRS